ncbi:MAG: MoaD/ThiS family protein [Chloroflexi bacterium]|nr:MoaD/ThiS family protein [Chloroflexota bacterium]
MVLIAANTGFGNTDLASIPAKSVDLDGGWVDFARVKNGIRRRIPLWPETVEAIREEDGQHYVDLAISTTNQDGQEVIEGLIAGDPIKWEALVADLTDEVRRQIPELAPPEVKIVVAVNTDYADSDIILQPGDDVCLIPPVSGG